MTNPTTAGALTKGARVLVELHDHEPMTFATDPTTARVAEVHDIEKAGRRRRVLTDLGPIEAGPTARVTLAPTTSEQAGQIPPLATTATATLSPVGCLMTESVVRVNDQEATVPAHTQDGSAAALPRLAQALAELGYVAASAWRKLDASRVAVEVRKQ